jgi:hypothetical protein
MKVLSIEVLPDGDVVLPQDDDFSLDVAEALNDPSAKEFCEQTKMTEVLVGKRMCG